KMLEDCEQNLRRMVAEAAGEGDYATVLRITDWAKALAALAAEARSSRPTSLNERAVANQLTGVPTENGKNRLALTSAPATGRQRKSLRDEYPKFFRRNGELVKVGWSKKDRKEYNHRAPREAIDAVAAAVRQIG